MRGAAIGPAGGRAACGFTLVEIMVIVVIVGILVGIAIPRYRSSVLEANRAEAREALETIAARQEQYRANHGSYTAELAALWRVPDVNDCVPGDTLVAMTPSCRYGLAVTDFSDTAFTVAADPLGRQEADDCGTLTLDHDGRKGAAGPVDACWEGE